MKRIQTVFLVLVMMCCLSINAFATDEVTSLDDVINSQMETTQPEIENSTEDKETGTYERNKDFIAGLNQAADLTTPDLEGAEKVTGGIKYVAAFVVQLLSYAVTVLLAVRVVLDLAYIGLPFIRGFLANGYQGNAQAGAGGAPNSMMNGPMAGGMMSLGSPHSMMNRGMAPGGGMMPGGMSLQTSNMNQGGSMMGRIQWVSNAALNAVAAESSVGPDGKAVSPFKNYCKDMAVVLILVPILLTLAVTGSLTSLGFLIADMLVDLIGSIGDML